MASETIYIGCKLPVGITLQDPEKADNTVTLKGANDPIIRGTDYGVTPVDRDFWTRWKATHMNTFAPFTSGAIFEARNESEAHEKAKDRANVKTGFEKLEPESNGVKKAEFDGRR